VSGIASGSWPYRGVLVTGGAGYLGTNLVRRLAPHIASSGGRVRILSRRGSSLAEPASGIEVERVTGDLRDPGLWPLLVEGMDLIFHLAAQTSVYAAEEDPLTDHEINVVATLRLLEAARRGGRGPAIILAGTATQAGLTRALPVDESVPDAPVTIYDLHKMMAENYLRYYVACGHVRGASLRLSNVYGPGPASGSADRGVLNVFVRRALRGETLTVYGEGFGLRDYVYVDDAVEAFAGAARGIDRIDGGYFVIGTGQGTSIRDAVARVAARVEARTGRRPQVAHVPPPRPPSPIEARDFVANSARFRDATGWSARVSLDEGIDRTIDAVLSEERVRE
jgi:nucleoside-diphosphate-sugar epimerase